MQMHRKVGVHAFELTAVRAPMQPTNAHFAPEVEDEVTPLYNDHTAIWKRLLAGQRTLTSCFRHTHTHSRTIPCPLTLNDLRCSTKALSSSFSFLVFLCYCYGFLFWS